MMPSIFSTFDFSMLPMNSTHSNLFYSTLPSIMLLQMFWLTPPSRLLWLPLLTSISSSLSNSTHGKFFKGFASSLTSTFYLIIVMNMWGTAPYILALTSHLLTTLSLGSPMWMSAMLTSMINKMKMSSAHFLPENTPLNMASFLSMVETLSSYIRPITLSFRLAANISAGHVILGMMTTASSTTLLTNLMMIYISLPLLIGVLYLMFEFMICLAQAFVFTLLSAMYTSDYIPRTH